MTRLIVRLGQTPFGLGLVLLALPLMAGTWITQPEVFAVFYELHGFIFGAVCFFYGLLFVRIGAEATQGTARARWLALGLAVALYWLRVSYGEIGWRMALEAWCWMLAFMGFGAHYLTRPTPAWRYLSAAVFPVYILHLPVQAALSGIGVVTGINPWIAFPIMTIATISVSVAIYHFGLRRITWFRPLFGLGPLPVTGPRAYET